MKPIKRCLSKAEKNTEVLRKQRVEKAQNDLDKQDSSNNSNKIKKENNNDKLLMSKNKCINISKNKESNLVKRNERNNINYNTTKFVFEIIKIIKMLILSIYLIFTQEEKNKEKKAKKVYDKLSLRGYVDSLNFNIMQEIKEIIYYIYIIKDISIYSNNKNNNKYKDGNLIKEKKIKNIKSELKIIAFKKIKIIITCILLLNLIYKIESKINLHGIFLYNNTEIVLKISKIGIQKILNADNLHGEYPCPSSIYLNNKDLNLSSCTNELYISSPESIVKLVWNEPLNSSLSLFHSCENITEINFVSFDTSVLDNGGYDMGYIFKGCSSLISVNLSSIDTKNANLMDYMFSDCLSIRSINLGNFNTSSVSRFEYMFNNCSNLEYINLENFTDSRSININNMFNGIAKNAVICIDQNKAPYIYNLTNNTECFTISCEPDWRKFQKKLDNETNECCDDCYLNLSKFEYEGKCYSTCPDNTINYNHKCYDKEEEEICHIYSNCTSCPENKYLKKGKCYCKEEYPFEIAETQICVSYCTIIERQEGLCKINYEQNEESNKEIEEKALENVKEELTNDFNTSDIDNGKDVIINQKYSTITISSSENQKKDKSSDRTTIDLGECETKIKQEYNISQNDTLYILKIDVKQEGYQIPKIIYEVYYPLFGNNLIKLNLTVCEGIKIDISIPIKLPDNLDIYNSSSDYYNDICYTYTSEDGTDITLSDRKNNFVNNKLTVCEEDCDFVSYDNVNERAICSCNVKTETNTHKISGITIDKNKLLNSFIDFKNFANVKVLTCINSIFKLEAFKYNYGNWIMIAIILLLFITLIIFLGKGYPNIKKIMDLIEYFKINSTLVKNFQNKKNNINMNEEEVTPEKKSKRRNIISEFNNKNKFKSKNKKSRQKKINNDNNKHNPIKRNKKAKKYIKDLLNIKNNKDNIILNKNNKNKKENKNNIVTIMQTKEEPNNNNNINQKNFPYEMNQNQMYDMFSKIYNQTDSELNDLDYKKALQFDYRTYSLYYISLIRTNHLLFFSFGQKFDFNSREIKVFLFFFNLGLSFATNSLFFDDKTMHKIYEEKGTFDFIYNIPQILFSSLISWAILAIIQFFALTESNIMYLKEKANKNTVYIEKQKQLKRIIIKIIFFFIVSFIFLICFWIYLACFCFVYKNTQIHLIKDTLLSFGTSMITPFIFAVFPGIFRISALRAKEKNKKCRYNLSKALQLLI